jgi:WD40 repeat protein
MPDYNPDQIKPAWKLQFEGAWPMAVAFCGSHQRLAAANQDGQVVLWDLPADPAVGKIKNDQGKEEEGIEAPPPARVLQGHGNGVTRLLPLPDGNTLISASLDRSVRVWDLSAAPSGEAEIVLDSDRREARAKRVSEDKRKDILEAPGVKVGAQEAAAVLSGHKEWINALGVSADGKRAISGDDSGLVIVWDLAARKELTRWQCPGVAWVTTVALSPDGSTAVVSQFRRKGGDYNNYPAGLRLYDVASGKVKLDILAEMFPKEKNPPYQYQYQYGKFMGPGLVCSAFSPDGKLIALGQGGEDGDGKVHLLEAESGKLVRDVSGHQYGTTNLLFTKDGKHLFTAGRDTMVRIIQVEDGKELAKLGKQRGGQFHDWISAISLSPDERWLAGADISGHVQTWRLEG